MQPGLGCMNVEASRADRIPTMPVQPGGRLHWGGSAHQPSRRGAAIKPTVSTHTGEPSTRSTRTSRSAVAVCPAIVVGAFKEPHADSVSACRACDANKRVGARIGFIVADPRPAETCLKPTEAD